MTEALIIITILLALLGCSIAIWSVVQTRRFYYDEYMSRKGEEE